MGARRSAAPAITLNRLRAAFLHLCTGMKSLKSFILRKAISHLKSTQSATKSTRNASFLSIPGSFTRFTARSAAWNPLLYFHPTYSVSCPMMMRKAACYCLSRMEIYCFRVWFRLLRPAMLPFLRNMKN